MTTQQLDQATLRAIGIALGFVLATTFAPTLARADHGDCGQPASRGPKPSSGDALVVLKDAIGVGTCGDNDNECECDVNDSGDVTSGDALVVLRSAVGVATNLNCKQDCVAPGTTLPGDATTTTLGDGPEASTTTTLGDGSGASSSTTLQDDDGQGDEGQGDDDQGGDKGGDGPGGD